MNEGKNHPAAAQADSPNPHLAAPWEMEPFAGFGSWGDRFTVRTCLGQAVALDIPKHLAEFMVEWVNVGIEATRPLTPEEQEEAMRAARGEDEDEQEAEGRAIAAKIDADAAEDAEADRAEAEHDQMVAQGELEADRQAARDEEGPVI